MNLCHALKALKQIRDDIRHIRRALEKATRGRVTFYIGGQQVRRLQMKDTDKGLLLSIEFDDAAGFATNASADSAPQWTDDANGAVVKLTPSDDGLTCKVEPVAPGNANVQCIAMVGGQQFVGNLPTPVEAGDAVSMKLNAAPLE